jgi:hypothetical protein
MAGSPGRTCRVLVACGRGFVCVRVLWLYAGLLLHLPDFCWRTALAASVLCVLLSLLAFVCSAFAARESAGLAHGHAGLCLTQVAYGSWGSWLGRRVHVARGLDMACTLHVLFFVVVAWEPSTANVVIG